MSSLPEQFLLLFAGLILGNLKVWQIFGSKISICSLSAIPPGSGGPKNCVTGSMQHSVDIAADLNVAADLGFEAKMALCCGLGLYTERRLCRWRWKNIGRSQAPLLVAK